VKTRTWLFFGATALMVFLRLMYQVSYFPPFFEGEESQALDLAKATCEFAAYFHSWWAAVTGGLIEYNKGYGWALVPFYLHFGYDVRLIYYILPVIFSLICAAFFTLYRTAYPRSSLLSFALIAVFSLLCLCLRRYKWHSVVYVTAISVYLYFLPLYCGGIPAARARWIKAFAVFLFFASCYFYFGGLMYGLPFLLLIVFFSSEAQRRWELWVGCLGMIAFMVLFVFMYNVSDLWGLRVREELQFVMKAFTRDGFDRRWWGTRDFFFTLYLTTPYLIFLVVGLAVSVRRIRRGDAFAIVNTTLLGCLWAFQITIEGLGNPDQLHWSMIPLIGALLMGADAIFVALRENLRLGTALGAVLALAVGLHEMHYYLRSNRDATFQVFIQEHNTRTQAALLLRMIRDDDSNSVVYYMPDPSIPEVDGGFDYSVSLLRADYAKAFTKFTYFTSEDDLRRKLAAQRRDKWAVIYLSVCDRPLAEGSKERSEIPLLGQPPVIIHPYEDIYEIPFQVRRFKMRPGPAALQASPAVSSP
jgi:hypothetical protein